MSNGSAASSMLNFGKICEYLHYYVYICKRKVPFPGIAIPPNGIRSC